MSFDRLKFSNCKSLSHLFFQEKLSLKTKIYEIKKSIKFLFLQRRFSCNRHVLELRNEKEGDIDFINSTSTIVVIYVCNYVSIWEGLESNLQLVFLLS